MLATELTGVLHGHISRVSGHGTIVMMSITLDNGTVKDMPFDHRPFGWFVDESGWQPQDMPGKEVWLVPIDEWPDYSIAISEPLQANITIAVRDALTALAGKLDESGIVGLGWIEHDLVWRIDHMEPDGEGGLILDATSAEFDPETGEGEVTFGIAPDGTWVGLTPKLEKLLKE